MTERQQLSLGGKTINGYVQFIQVHVRTFISVGIPVKLSATRAKNFITEFVAERVPLSQL